MIVIIIVALVAGWFFLSQILAFLLTGKSDEETLFNVGGGIFLMIILLPMLGGAYVHQQIEMRMAQNGMPIEPSEDIGEYLP